MIGNVLKIQFLLYTLISSIEVTGQGTASEMECPKTQCTLNESPMCDNDTYMYQHKQCSSLQNSEKTLAKLFTDAEMKNATNGFWLANIDELFKSHNNVSSNSGFVRGLASKKHARMVLFSMPIERSTKISSKTICPPLISHVCTNPIVFVYVIGVLLFTICFILGFILNKAYRNQRKETLHSISDVFSLEDSITTTVYPEPSSPPPAPPPPPSNTRTLEAFTDVLAAHDMMDGNLSL
eukprot:XP_011457157.1 PREDICTED: uncharacterized protein LOC105349164 [Crassostrea gigas]